MQKKSRRRADIIRYFLTYASTFLCCFILIAILGYVFVQGSSNLSWNLISSDYESILTTLSVESIDIEYENPNFEGTFFSSRYGIALKDGKDTGGNACIYVVYIDEDSPFVEAICIDNTENKDTKIALEENSIVSIVMGESDSNSFLMASTKDGAQVYAETLEQMKVIDSIQTQTSGGGIRGSLLTTLLLIVVTLIIALPLGIGGAIYLVEYAKEGKIKSIISTMIDMTSGIPSIIFGFCGAAIFIPFVSSIGGKSGYTILAGALTMTIVLLPTIIKTTSEALMVIPNSYTMASLALGASKTQTVFKVILPNAIPGILTATLLSIGRIIGESAALLFVMGSNINDSVDLMGQSTSLSLHIWSITSGENPNYSTACSISIIILIVVFILSITVKLLSRKMNKMVVK